MRIYTHPEYLNHLVMDGHPERPERLVHLMDHWQRIGLTQDFQMIEPQPIDNDRVLAAHSQSHIDFLLASQPEEGLLPLDPDTWMSVASLSAARLAAGAVFATLVFSISVLGLPMILDRDVDFVTALITSIGAVGKSPFTYLIWGLFIGLITLLAMIPFFLGLFFVLPVLGHATWHLYKRVTS